MPLPRIRQLPPRPITPASTQAIQATADTLTSLFAKKHRLQAELDSVLTQIAALKGERG